MPSRRTSRTKCQQAIVIFCLIFLVLNLKAQQTIRGNVWDSASNALPSASVNVVDDKGTLFKFAFTDKAGAFTLTLAREPTQPLWLEVSYIGYKKQRLAFSASLFVYNFNLKQDQSFLKEVVVERKQPIEAFNDTLRYNVERFSQPEDRSIRDVLRRMPGIEMDPDGTIYHNGKKISNLYIQGDDLMSGRYGTATKVIQKDMIVSVDVIRNHQPIKVLKNKINVDNTAVNLILKDPASLKLSGSATVGTGWPKLYDVSGTAILLNDRLKGLNNIAFNNTGINYNSDLKQLGSSNFTSSINNNPPEFSLTQATIGPPDLPLPAYYFNNSDVINLNELYKTKKDIQFKLNLQFFKDRNSLNYFSRMDNYLQNDTLSFREQQYITNRPSQWNTTLNITVNKAKYFFNNSTLLEFDNENSNSFMNFNNYSFKQDLNKKITRFSNDIHWIPSLAKKGIGELRWYLSYNGSSQSLDIGKGYYFQLPDQENNYDRVLQRLKIPTLFSNLYFGYKIPGNLITQQYTAGFIQESEGVDSRLLLVKNNATMPYQRDAGNNLNWDRSNIYFSPEYQFKNKRLRSTIHLPVSYQRIHYSQLEYSLDSKNTSVLFNPSVKVNYDFNPERSLNASYTFNNNFSDISGVFRGGILRNYRTFIANDADLQQKVTQSFAATYNFQKAINMLFLNIGISLDKIIADAILSTTFSSNVQKIIFLPLRNNQSRLTIRGGYSKYLFKLRTTVSLKSSWTSNSYMQILNSKAQQFNSNMILVNAKIMKKLLQRASLVYEPSALWNASGLRNSNNGASVGTNKFFRLDQYLSFKVNALNGLNVELAGKHSMSKHINSKKVQYFFMDAKATYSITKKRVDLSLSITNLLNVTNYTVFSITPYQFSEDQYPLRGRMGIFKLDYYF